MGRASATSRRNSVRVAASMSALCRGYDHLPSRITSDPTLGQTMSTARLRANCGLILLLAMLSCASPSLAQQNVPSTQQSVPALSQPQVSPAEAASSVQEPSVVAPTVPAPAAANAAAVTPADSSTKSLKLTTSVPRELSPWSMFLSADILVKAVMIGLAFASLVTWTIFIAKMIELSLVHRKLRAALDKISDARSLAEAQFALGAKDSVLSLLLSAAMREARLSAGISSDSGIKERGSCADDAAGAGLTCGWDSAGTFCCASDGDAHDSIASKKIRPQFARRSAMLMVWPKGGLDEMRLER